MGVFDSLLIRANCFLGMHLTSVISEVTEKIQEMELDSNLVNKVDTVGATGVNLFTRVGVYLSIIAIIAFGLGILFADDNDRAAKKKAVLPKSLGILLIIGATGLLAVFELVTRGILSVE